MSDLSFDVMIDGNKYVARSKETGMVAYGADWDDLKAKVRALINDNFDDSERPPQFQLMLAGVLAVIFSTDPIPRKKSAPLQFPSSRNVIADSPSAAESEATEIDPLLINP